MGELMQEPEGNSRAGKRRCGWRKKDGAYATPRDTRPTLAEAGIDKRLARRGRGLVRGAALHFMHYNFVKIHQSLRTTPAQAAGVTNRLWETEDLVALLEG